MKHKIFFISIVLFSFCLTGSKCEKDRPDFNGLPAATQEGKNTLGFLLNGEPWVSKGFSGTANLSIDFDPGVKKGVLGIAAYNIISNDEREYFGLGIIDSLNFLNPPFTIDLSNGGLFRIRFENNLCSLFSDEEQVVSTGKLTVTKLDRNNQVISGKFSATLRKEGCFEIKITEGRFDMKY